MTIINSIVSIVNYNRLAEIDSFRRNPHIVQYNVLKNLINYAQDTEFGRLHGFDKIKSYDDFIKNVPVRSYEEIKPFIQKSFEGQQNVLWPGETKWFAKSSGTTSDKSKFIPITKESLEECHFRSGKDIFIMYADKFPESSIFLGKSLAIGGSTSINTLNENSYFGDLSAVIIKNLPLWTYLNRIPPAEIALIQDWETKLNKIVEISHNKNVTNIIGVPSWLLVLLKRLLEYTKKSNILEVWPNLELFVHGGVSFVPYRKTFETLIHSKSMTYLETYNASEGFFAIQDEFSQSTDGIDKGMLLMLDYGIFFEFIELSDYLNNNYFAVPLEQVKPNINYVLVISTNGGLWRYVIGDTVSFTSTNPYRIKITGRTKHYINAFGEEIIIDNVQTALAYASSMTNAEIKEYTAAPIFYEKGSQGAHQYLIEFLTPPNDLELFRFSLDKKIKELNSDYEAKRTNDITLGPPDIIIAKTNTFYKWLQQKGKLGGQNKIPRLSNTREYIDELLKINSEL